MIRVLNAYFPTRTLLLGLTEAFWVTFAFVAATITRVGTDDARLVLNYESGFLKIIIVAAVFIVCMYYFDMYDSLVFSNHREVYTRLVEVFGTVCILLSVIYYAFPSLQLGRGIFLIGFGFVALVLLIWRRLFLAVNALPQLAERTVVLGDGPLAQPLMREIESRAELGMRVVGQIQHLDSGSAPFFSLSNAEQFEELDQQVKSYKAGRVIVAMGERRGRLPVEALLHLKSKGVRIQDGAEVYEAVTGKVPVQSLHLSWLLFSPGFQVSRPLLIYKRIFSFTASVIGLILISPLLALIALAIRLDSKGPVIFTQKRIGEGGKAFTLYKFRTMIDGADRDDNHRPATEMDDRFTRVGRWLRIARVDELPQLFNILKGDMYFVGPRPFVPNQEEECLAKIPFYRQRWAVKPGATGWAQVNRGYCATIEDNIDKLAYDLFYIKNISIGLDMLIMFRTMKTLLLSRGSR